MPRFDFEVTVEAATREQADQVMAERFQHDEDYGFDYNLWGWTISGDPNGYGE